MTHIEHQPPTPSSSSAAPARPAAASPSASPRAASPSASAPAAATPPFDWEDRATWAAGARRRGAAYITFFPDLAVPGAADAVAEFAQIAAANGVRGSSCCPAAARPEAAGAPSRRVQERRA